MPVVEESRIRCVNIFSLSMYLEVNLEFAESITLLPTSVFRAVSSESQIVGTSSERRSDSLTPIACILRCVRKAFPLLNSFSKKGTFAPNTTSFKKAANSPLLFL